MAQQNLKDLIANDLNVIKNSLIIYKSNITALATQTTPPTLNQQNASVYQNTGNVPLLLKSLFVSYDSTFLQYYSIYISLEGLNIDNNTFNAVPGSSSGFDFVPTGSNYFIPAGATLKIWVYNNTSTNTTNGTFNVLAIFDKLDTYNL